MKRKIILGAVVTAAILVLAAAAYLAVNWMTPGSEGINLLGLNLFGSGGKESGRVRVLPASEKPITDPAIAGYMVERQDNSLIVQPIIKGAGKLENSGPQVEVVITNETVLYRDATFDDLSRADMTGGTTIQEILEPITLNEVVIEDTFVLVWGERRGDRLIATFMTFQHDVQKK